MKALKHSPEWTGPLKRFINKDGSDVAFIPYSRMTALHVHIKGVTKDKRQVEGYYGKGAETLFVDLGINLSNNIDPFGQAKLVHDNFVVAPKMKDEID